MGLWEKRMKSPVAKLTVVTVQHTKKSFVPQPHFNTAVSIGNCIRARELYHRKSAPLFSIYTVNMKICHITQQLSGYSTARRSTHLSLNYRLSCRLLSKNITIILSRTMALPIVLYGCGTSFLTYAKRVWQRMLTKTFGPTREKETRRQIELIMSFMIYTHQILLLSPYTALRIRSDFRRKKHV